MLSNKKSYCNVLTLPLNYNLNFSGGLILDIPEITESLQIDRLLMTVDIEKAFDSVNHFFLISVLK